VRKGVGAEHCSVASPAMASTLKFMSMRSGDAKPNSYSNNQAWRLEK